LGFEAQLDKKNAVAEEKTSARTAHRQRRKTFMPTVCMNSRQNAILSSAQRRSRPAAARFGQDEQDQQDQRIAAADPHPVYRVNPVLTIVWIVAANPMVEAGDSVDAVLQLRKSLDRKSTR
jgi:hypothetical protein